MKTTNISFAKANMGLIVGVFQEFPTNLMRYSII